MKKYIYPPRPLIKSPASALDTFERMGMIAQPKLNGSCAVLSIDNASLSMMGRHKNTFTRQHLKTDHLLAAHRGVGEIVLVGEYMNKSKKDHTKKTFDAFVIFDIIVYQDRHLLGTTFEERQELLDSLYIRKADHGEFLSVISDSLYRVKNFTSGFSELWKRAIEVDMVEGFVLKKPQGKLEQGLRENNNTSWQVKIRKETKNYKY